MKETFVNFMKTIQWRRRWKTRPRS